MVRFLKSRGSQVGVLGLAIAGGALVIGATPGPLSPTQVSAFCGNAPLRPCDTLISESLPKTEENVQLAVTAFKEGKVLNPNAGENESPYMSGYQIETPTCTVGQMGAPCGNPCKFVCTQTGGPSASASPSPAPSPSASPSPGPSPVPLHVTCTLDSVAGVCALERSWTRGALVALVNAKLQEVKSEIQSPSHTFSLGTRCQALANTMPQTMTRFETAKTLWDEYSSNNAQLPTCAVLSPQAGASPLPAPDAETSSPAVAHCLMTSVIPMMSSFAFQAAACEVFARAETQWVATEADKYPENMKINLQNAVGACTGALPPFPGSLTQCVNSQYAATIQAAFSNVTSAPAPAMTPPAGKMNACVSSSPTVSPWEPILCSSTPPTPFHVSELGAMINASQSLDQVGAMLDGAASLMSGSSVPVIQPEN